ncbi:unnamed protein product [Trichobilharzia regenti]|nr:unnamed protein product [Trichobilharzia regenti]
MLHVYQIDLIKKKAQSIIEFLLVMKLYKSMEYHVPAWILINYKNYSGSINHWILQS